MFCADLPEVRARDVTLSIRSLCPRVMSPLKNWGPRLAAFFLGFYHWSLRQVYVLPHSEQRAASPHFHTKSAILTPGRSVEIDDEKSRFFHAARPGFEPRTFRMRGRHTNLWATHSTLMLYWVLGGWEVWRKRQRKKKRTFFHIS